MRLFKEHPASVGETYFGHLVCATGFALRMFFGSIACLIHAVFPFLFVKTGSECITKLHDCMVTNRSKLPQQHNAPAMQKSEAA